MTSLHSEGSGAFNRTLRQFAVESGFSLNEHELLQKSSDGTVTKIEILSEDHIFEALGLQYYSPTDREFGK